MDFFPGEGSNLDEIVAEQIGWDIDVFCLAKRGDDKIMKIHEKLQKMTKKNKNIDIFDHDCSENHKKHEKWQKMTKNIYIFEYDCSENHEIMVVLMDLEAETLSESRSLTCPNKF